MILYTLFVPPLVAVTAVLAVAVAVRVAVIVVITAAAARAGVVLAVVEASVC